MVSSDRIGTHGEFVFLALISRSCRGRFYFRPIHMGEKHPTVDMVVELLDPPGFRSRFYVQVKSTTRGYAGSGDDAKLKVRIDAPSIERLKQYPGPSYVAGIDTEKGRGYLAAIVSDTQVAIHALPTRHPINCILIRKLWAEVDSYWNADSRPIPMTSSAFGI